MIANSQKSLFNFSLEKLTEILKEKGFPPFRAKQIHEFLYKKKVCQFEQMKNLPQNLIHFLKSQFSLTSLSLIQKFDSQINENTSKMLLKTFDDHFIEMVIMPNSKGHFTVCLSTQIGCPMACDFCATGKMGLTRSLEKEEILGQFLLAAHSFPISNIVFMGMGEPFLNPHFFETLDVLISPSYFHFKDRSITVSTSGIIEGIEHMSSYKQVKLALSYHSSIPEVRKVLFPVLHMRHSFDEIAKAIVEYHKKTAKRITLEYTLIKGVNDTPLEAEKLLLLSQKLYFFLNIIPYNENSLSPYKTPSSKDIKRFVSYFGKKVPLNVRSSLGSDIEAACGQLAAQQKEFIKE
jgi:23S rRNA (adenine2503-C2)-methyltransferase